MRSARMKPGTALAVTIAVFSFVVMPLLGALANVWTDYLWYVDLGQEQVYLTRIWVSLGVFAAFAVPTFLVLFLNMRIARTMAPRGSLSFESETLPEQLTEFILRARAKLGPTIDKLIVVAALGFAISIGAGFAAQWQTFRIALAGVPFGFTDPQFGKDVGFFVFQLPALEAVRDWLSQVLVLSTVLSLIVHLVDGGIDPFARLKGFAPHVKAHLSVLMALFVAARGYAYWLAIFGLSYSPRGQVTGASYTDVHAQLPAYWILVVASAITAFALLLNIRFKGWRLPALAIGTWVVISVIVGSVWPGLMQQFVVGPNEAALEAPYMKRNIKMTRRAFELTDVKGRDFAAADSLTADAVREDSATIDNVRLWDPAIMKQSYSQLQSIRPYYDFADVDVDRYMIGGRMRQVLISAREMNSSQLADTAQTWVNRHLVYTHGIGLVMTPASESDSRGLPRFAIGDIPPRVSSAVASDSPALETKQPRIYFGEDTRDYVLVGTGMKEFDYPQGEKNATYQYKGDGGVAIGSLPRRLAWAMRLGSAQVLFSQYVKPDSRVLVDRDLITRLNKLAPWLTYEDDPYPVLVDGRIVWVIDAYTSSDKFPNSEALDDGTNYLRNSVKVTVDAFTGETTFYAFDPSDPVLAAWGSVFPTLLTDAKDIPAGIRAHFRYPQGLFSAQAEIYRTYHMTDVSVFYNKEDQWEIPGERKGRAMEPFFVLLRLPGQASEKFYMMQPYTPRNRDNMIGWMAVSCDEEDYGDRTVYLFPKERVILGPEQVKARINQDSIISPQLSLWNQRGSQVLFGNMLVVPIGESIVYIQPLFLQAEETAIPELTRIVVAYADKVEMERTLETALLKVFGAVTPTPSAEESGTPGGEAGQPASAAISEAVKLYEEALTAQKAGDWAVYGARIEELGRMLGELAGKETTSTK